MGLDLSDILDDWPFEPGQLNVRLVPGDDGEPKLQMRIDLGLLQMEVTGRPDGLRPNGYESLLDYFEELVSDPITGLDRNAEGGPEMGPGLGPEGDGAGEDNSGEVYLSAEDCRLLREEALQYYHRYVALLVLGDYEGVIRDTTRNLRALDLCRDHAEEEDDRMVLEQFRPYVMMMRSRALASQAVLEDEHAAALLTLEHGIDALKALFDDSEDPSAFEQSSEVQLLRGMRAELMNKLPASQTAELRERLSAAIEAENYELAAILRDELKTMRDDAPPPTRA